MFCDVLEPIESRWALRASPNTTTSTIPHTIDRPADSSRRRVPRNAPPYARHKATETESGDAVSVSETGTETGGNVGCSCSTGRENI